MEQASKYAFRLACARYFCEELLEKLQNVVKDVPHVTKQAFRKY